MINPLAETFRRQPALTVYGVACLACAAITFGLQQMDARLIDGVDQGRQIAMPMFFGEGSSPPSSGWRRQVDQFGIQRWHIL